jgi:single-strand DNA-binding protein
MQTVIGRLTADAKVSTLKDGREVVNFSLAHNERYKPKGSDKAEQITTYYNGSYWISTGIAPLLKKGTLVEVGGRIGLNVWNNREGETKASLTLHANYIQLHGKAKTDSPSEAKLEPEQKDDLPF